MTWWSGSSQIVVKHQTIPPGSQGPNINSLTSPLSLSRQNPPNQNTNRSRHNTTHHQQQMSRFSSSPISFLDPLSYYSSPPHATPFGYHSNPDHNAIKECFDLSIYSTSSLPSNQFAMHNTPVFNSSSSSSSSSSGEYLDFNSSPVRRVFSTGDLQVVSLLQYLLLLYV